jgi:hypothetical protein
MAKKLKVLRERKKQETAELKQQEPQQELQQEPQQEQNIIVSEEEMQKKQLFFELLKELYDVDVWDENQQSFFMEIEGFDKVKPIEVNENEEEITNTTETTPTNTTNTTETTTPIITSITTNFSQEEINESQLLTLLKENEDLKKEVEDLKIQLKKGPRNFKAPKFAPIKGGTGYFNSDMYGQKNDY